jgi:transaldolase
VVATTILFTSLTSTSLSMRSLRLASFFVVSAAALVWIPPHRGTSRFFLDSADVNEWHKLLPTGIFHGVTTNPELLEAAKEPCTMSNIHNLAAIALRQTNEFMCQACGSTVADLVACGEELVRPNPDRIIVKLPVNEKGLQAADILILKNVRVCLTACYDKKQALPAVGVGAEYLAPYVGRMNDNGKNGMDETFQMHKIVEGLGSDTRILVASVRDVETLTQLAALGLNSFTFSPDIARQLLTDPLTEKAATDFEEAAYRNSK